MSFSLLIDCFLAFSATVLLIWVLRPIAFRIDLLDHPGGHRLHEIPTPLVGGIALFIAFFSLAFLSPLSLPQLPLLFAGSWLLLLTGVLDDLYELSPGIRFIAQIGASLLMCSAGVVLSDLGALFSEGQTVTLGSFGIPFTVFASMGVINALNLSDGLDGLAGSLALVAIGGLLVVAGAGEHREIVWILGLLAAALLGFLFWNLGVLQGRALVFLGDGGSLFLGFVLAWFLIQGSQGEARLFPPAVALWLFALPLSDTVAVLGERLMRGTSPFQADRTHLHHLLLDRGFSTRQTLGILVSGALVSATLGLFGHFYSLPEPWLFFGFLGLFLGHLGIRTWLRTNG